MTWFCVFISCLLPLPAALSACTAALPTTTAHLNTHTPHLLHAAALARVARTAPEEGRRREEGKQKQKQKKNRAFLFSSLITHLACPACLTLPLSTSLSLPPHTHTCCLPTTALHFSLFLPLPVMHFYTLPLHTFGFLLVCFVHCGFGRGVTCAFYAAPLPTP